MVDFNVTEIIVQLIGGLALFLYGMNVMGEGLQKSAGDKMKSIIESLTRNRIMAVLVGTVVTAIIQSSSATTVMVVGLVNAGIMNLTQSVGIIMGADIGTTITAQLVSINLTALAPFSIALGVVINLSTKNPKIKKYAEILIGFGILFMGMDIMKGACKPLRSYEPFTNLLTRFGSGSGIDTFLAIGTGFLVTAVIQSSSATTGIMIALAGAGLLNIESAFPVLLGANIGTCVTALLSSIGTKRVAKRAAIMHLTIKVIGTTIFAIFLSGITVSVVQMMSSSPERQIAWAHTLFNVVNTMILLPFAPLLVKFVMKVLPQQSSPEEKDYTLALDDRILGTPYIALEQVKNEITVMGDLAVKSFHTAMDGFLDSNPDNVTKVNRYEEKINLMEEEILEYLVKMSNSAVSGDQREMIDTLFNSVNDIERLGDHAENIAELTTYKIKHQLKFSSEANVELREIYEVAKEALDIAIANIKNEDQAEASKVVEIEQRIDELEEALRKKHIRRLSDGICQAKSGVIFLDLINNIERVGDHAMNIAEIHLLDA
ncbi:Na/Pi cotransporter family protein [Acidaminobacter sp. JC074]|uniref:Na/Pi cotransporter family protein n=1 Tax=Acidaminobacter sp. JC074 TaxID=2530199 RepID=UPI001F0D3C20|nr:Na/Pi cotransporter family protein [Acidaminobacter sp. JC074]MCH4886359.1 Na/Pi cotransporter family protein [Acidaminobacter sp. JC074]